MKNRAKKISLFSRVSIKPFSGGTFCRFKFRSKNRAHKTFLIFIRQQLKRQLWDHYAAVPVHSCIERFLISKGVSNLNFDLQNLLGLHFELPPNQPGNLNAVSLLQHRVEPDWFC